MSSYHAEKCVQARQLGSHYKEGGLEIHELGATVVGRSATKKDRRAPTWQGYTMRWVTMWVEAPAKRRGGNRRRLRGEQ